MAILNAQSLTLLDITKRIDPNGKQALIAEMLNQSNVMLNDIPWMPANGESTHRVTVRTGLPTVSVRTLNQGTALSKSATAQMTESLMMLEAMSMIDERLLDYADNPAMVRINEAYAFLESMNQTMIEKIFYGDTNTNDKELLGLQSRYNSLSGGNAQNVLSAGGAATNASVYLVCWGQNSVFGLYPKGSQAGLKHVDIGIETVFDSNGNPYRAFMDQYKWDCGLCVKDWRNVVRICNINTAHLAALSNTQAITAVTNLVDLIYESLSLIPNLSAVKPVLYCNRTVFFGLKKMMARLNIDSFRYDKSMDENGVASSPMMTFMGVPIRIVDRLTNAETTVS